MEQNKVTESLEQFIIPQRKKLDNYYLMQVSLSIF